MEFAAKDAGTAASEDKNTPTRGATVALHGLAKQAQHNGATGIVTDEINEKDGRLGVRIAYGEKARTLRVKPGNLRRVDVCASFDERGVAPCRVLSPKLMKDIASQFRKQKPWALPRAAETIVRAQLLREDAIVEEGYVSVSNSDPPSWAASQEEIAKRAKKDQIDKVVLDRNGYPYHGRVKAFADSVRENGLKL